MNVIMSSALTVSHYKTELHVSEPIPISRFWGSAIRGIIGHTLKNMFCLDRNAECPGCPLRATCHYVSIFSPYQPNTNRNIAPGFILRLDAFQTDGKTSSNKLSIGFNLFGKAQEYLPYIAFCLGSMGKYGLSSKRIPFTIDTISALSSSNEWTPIMENGKMTAQTNVHSFPVLENQDHQSIPPAPTQDRTITVIFKTPCRMKINGSFTSQPTFHNIMRLLFRRLSTLDYFYGNASLQDFPYSEWLDLASSIQCTSSDVCWYPLERYSNRQKTKMKFGGILGSITFQGPLTPFIPFLKSGEKIHLGKNTDFGLGQIDVNIIN
jgi:CRISPR-associated endoribonuclease Cas6